MSDDARSALAAETLGTRAPNGAITQPKCASRQKGIPMTKLDLDKATEAIAAIGAYLEHYPITNLERAAHQSLIMCAARAYIALLTGEPSEEMVERAAKAAKKIQPYSGKHARIRAALSAALRSLT